MERWRKPVGSESGRLRGSKPRNVRPERSEGSRQKSYPSTFFKNSAGVITSINEVLKSFTFLVTR